MTGATWAASLRVRAGKEFISRDDKGEPIVNTPADAFRTFQASDMDALALDNRVVLK